MIDAPNFKIRRAAASLALSLLSIGVNAVGAEEQSLIAETNPDTLGSVILDFEGPDALAQNQTTHTATVTLTEESLASGGTHAAKTLVDSAAGARAYFGTGFRFAATDLSGATEFRFWIKTDMESGFNLQIHSAPGGVSIGPFSTVGSGGDWKQITVPVKSMKVPPWAKAKADLKRISRIQVTAFGSGPYDGHYIVLDKVATDLARSVKPNEAGSDSPVQSPAGSRQLREPVVVDRGESVSLFDGQSLQGWYATPRVYVPRDRRFADIPSDRLYDAVIEHYQQSDGTTNRVPDRERVKNTGVWTVEDGVISGGQMPDSIAGSYLMTEKTYGDFELTLEANPDFPIDTGIMVRAHELGSVGYQVLVDNRPNGTIGGVFGNSVGMFFAYPFVFNADEEPLNRVANLRPGDPNALTFPGGQFKTDYAAPFDEFLNVWRPNDWNEIKVRCTGRLPFIETWINGMPIAKIDTATLADRVPGYDAEAIFERIGREGHIGLEVHDSPTRDRWAPGAQCRWRNVRIRELVCEERQETKPARITLAKINDRHWLVDSSGEPFFAHGITHVNTNRASFDFETLSDACKRIGFNAYGYGCPDQLRPDMPYIESWNHLVPISYYRGKNNIGYLDVFDPKVQAKLDAGVKANCARSLRHANNVIGFCWTDLGAWPLKNMTGKNWVDFIRNLPSDAPGRKVYEEFVDKWQGDDEIVRDQAFLRQIAREYFRVVGSANRKYAPDHLIFGDRFAFNTLDPDVVKEMLPWVDAIAIQPPFWGPFPKQQLDEVYELTGKPILLCDFAIRFRDGDKDVQMWKISDDSTAAATDYVQYVTAALESDYILGVFWCNPVDTPKGFGKPGVKQGFFGDGLTERPGLHQAVTKFNAYREEVTPTFNGAVQ
ncbi:MAG: DUF1080 domain-containing protein [Planctomycetota bacterium]